MAQMAREAKARGVLGAGITDKYDCRWQPSSSGRSSKVIIERRYTRKLESIESNRECRKGNHRKSKDNWKDFKITEPIA